MAWLNSDSLYVKFGTERATVANGGQYNVLGPSQTAEITLTLSTLGTATAIQNDVLTIPKNAFIRRVEVLPTTAAVGSGAVLNVGLIRTDRATTYDADGFIAALPTTSMDAAGETTILYEATTYNGALIGTNLTYAGLIVADYDTAAFTDGVVKITIHYHMTA